MLQVIHPSKQQDNKDSQLPPDTEQNYNGLQHRSTPGLVSC